MYRKGVPVVFPTVIPHADAFRPDVA